MKQYRVILLFFLALVGAQGTSLVSVRPLSARPGDTVTILVSENNCLGTNSSHLSNIQLISAGNDLVLSDRQAVSTCTLSYTGKVATRPLMRNLTLEVTGSIDGSPVGTLDRPEFDIVDIPAGPIPPGLTPQVDVYWTVLSEDNCSDEFGERLAKRYFCVDVVLGNNSGYPLLLAGIGFTRRASGYEYRDATASYRSTRAVIEREQVISGRNITLRTLQAAGAIIGPFAAFSSNAGRKGRIALWASIVGNTVATAFDNLVPDRTLRQANNLDDAAFRDGRLVPNNSPIRFFVFVDRETIKPILVSDPRELKSQAKSLGEQAKQDLSAAANLTGAERSAALTAANAENTEATALLALAHALESSPPNEKGNKHQNRGALDRLRLKRNAAPLENDLVSVRIALGHLIIIGDQIEFKQRIQVDATATVTPVAITPPGTTGTAGQPVIVTPPGTSGAPGVPLIVAPPGTSGSPGHALMILPSPAPQFGLTATLSAHLNSHSVARNSTMATHVSQGSVGRGWRERLYAQSKPRPVPHVIDSS